MSLNNFFKQKYINDQKQKELQRKEIENKIITNGLLRNQKSELTQQQQQQSNIINEKLSQALKNGTYPILPLNKHSFRDRNKCKELRQQNIKYSSPREIAQQSMQEFVSSHLKTGEFNQDQPHKNYNKWLKIENTSLQGTPMRFGKHDRIETERVRQLIQNNNKLDYVKKDLKMLIQPTWRQHDKNKWVSQDTFNSCINKRWKQIPLNNNNDVYIEGCEVLGDPSRKRYKEQEFKRNEFISTLPPDQFGTTMHISRSLRTYMADEVIQSEPNFDEYSSNNRLKFYKTGLLNTKSVDHLVPYRHSNNFQSLNFKNIRPIQNNKIFKQSCCITQTTNYTNKSPKITEIDTNDPLKTKHLWNIQELSKGNIEYIQQSETHISERYPYHQEDDNKTHTRISQYFN